MSMQFTTKAFSRHKFSKRSNMVLKITDLIRTVQGADSILNSVYRRQLLATITVNIIMFSHGIAMGWTAPTLRKLTSNESPLSFSVSVAESSWMASLIALGSMVGNIVMGVAVNCVGRKICLYIIALPHMGLWILTYLANSIEVLYIGRFIGGFTGGSSILVLPIFISEIADKNIRGRLCSFLPTAMNLGILIGYILSAKLNYFIVPCTVAVLPATYLILLTLFPETPLQLLRRNKDDAAFESLCFYGNYQGTKPKCQQQFIDLKSSLAENKDSSRITYRDYLKSSNYVIYLTATILITLNQFCGQTAFVNYMSSIFDVSGAPLEADTCTIIVGIVQLIGNLTATIFVDNYGRKTLMLISASGMGLGLIAFGCYTLFAESLSSTAYSWLPLVLMSFIIFIVNIGIVSVTLISVLEILPVKIRSNAFSACLLLLSAFVFLMLKTFPIYLYTFGISVTMFTCAAFTGSCLIYLAMFLPETKGKSMEID